MMMKCNNIARRIVLLLFLLFIVNIGKNQVQMQLSCFQVKHNCADNKAANYGADDQQQQERLECHGQMKTCTAFIDDEERGGNSIFDAILMRTYHTAGCWQAKNGTLMTSAGSSHDVCGSGGARRTEQMIQNKYVAIFCCCRPVDVCKNT